MTLTEILILPLASGSAVPEILISILYLKAAEMAWPATQPLRGPRISTLTL